MNNITIKYNGEEYQDSATFNVDSKRNLFTIQIGVNDNYNCNDFEVSSYVNWITYRRVRNIVDIIVEPNVDDNRYGIICFTYKLNRAIKFELEIHQDIPDYSILVKECDDFKSEYTNSLVLNGTKAFEPLTLSTDNEKYEKLIDIKCENGKPLISATIEYAQLNNAKDDYVKVNYDNGLNLFLIDDHTLKITSYGKANLYFNHYYIVTLKNKNAIYNEATIIIKYNTEPDNFSIR